MKELEIQSVSCNLLTLSTCFFAVGAHVGLKSVAISPASPGWTLSASYSDVIIARASSCKKKSLRVTMAKENLLNCARNSVRWVGGGGGGGVEGDNQTYL